MANQFEKAFNFQKKQLGQLFGQPCEILTIDYTAVDQTPVQLYPRKMYKMETTGPSLVQNPLPNGSYYLIHGDYACVNTGYLLSPLRTDSNTPMVTCISKSPFEEITGFRTSRTCDIYNGEELLYSNCYFDFATMSNYPGDPIHRLMSSNGVPENQILMYKRVLRTSDIDTEGLLLVDTNETPNVTWKIKQTSEIGNLMLLTVSMSVYE